MRVIIAAFLGLFLKSKEIPKESFRIYFTHPMFKGLNIFQEIKFKVKRKQNLKRFKCIYRLEKYHRLEMSPAGKECYKAVLMRKK